MFLRWKEAKNIARLMDINFLADDKKNRQAIGFAKMEG